jgi:hypothetical protein
MWRTPHEPWRFSAGVVDAHAEPAGQDQGQHSIELTLGGEETEVQQKFLEHEGKLQHT